MENGIEGTKTGDEAKDILAQAHAKEIPQVTMELPKAAQTVEKAVDAVKPVSTDPIQKQIEEEEARIRKSGKNPDNYSRNKDGIYVKNKNQKRFGEFKLKPGKKKTGPVPKAEPKPTPQAAPKPPPLNIPGTQPNPAGVAPVVNEMEIAAKEIVQMEEMVALMIFGTEWAFLDEEKRALCGAWISCFQKYGIIKMPWWIEMVGAHSLIFARRARSESTLTVIGRLKGWVYKMRNKRRQSEQKPKKGWFTRGEKDPEQKGE